MTAPIDFLREADSDELTPRVVPHGGRHRVKFELRTCQVWLDVEDARDLAEQLTMCAADAEAQNQGGAISS
jgi:hypothetical protein